MRNFELAITVLLILTLTYLPMKTEAASSKVEKTLAPGKVHEECMTLDKSQQIDFSYTADFAVGFNLHYHVGKEVFFPVQQEGKSEFKSHFKPSSKQDYCLMWTNAATHPVLIRYEFELR